MALVGRRHDSGIKNKSDPFRQAQQYFSDGVKVKADCGLRRWFSCHLSVEKS